ncbi:MAG: hypothetical protein QNJ46_31065 [Leptolyngbyaceae cyanobacterium MO_188.B28]|nr:hypothetical protein [Leptolyngbyaceae cyanobacterium MO_188.B28]
MGNPYLDLKNGDADDQIAIANLSKLLDSSLQVPSSQAKYVSPLSDGSDPAYPASYPKPKQFTPESEALRYVDPTSHDPQAVTPASYKDPKQSIAENKAKFKREKLEAEARQRAEFERRKMLETKARDFLKKIDALDPLDGDRMWFEQYAEKCKSRLEASIDFILNNAV